MDGGLGVREWEGSGGWSGREGMGKEWRVEWGRENGEGAEGGVGEREWGGSGGWSEGGESEREYYRMLQQKYICRIVKS